MSENWRAFDRAWFVRNQAALLWLLRCRATRAWFRWVLRIRAGDIGFDREIVGILPHCYTVAGAEAGTLTTDFRTHPKYAKRVYFAFRPLWWAMHYWDAVFADRWAPQLSFGFLTLTAYSDPTPGATTVDGIVQRSAVDETFSTISAGAGTEALTSQAAVGARIFSSATTNQFSKLERFICTFDTSPIGVGGVVNSTVLSLWGTGKLALIGSPDLHVAGSTPAVNNDLSAADYSQCQSTSFGSVAYAAWDQSGTVYTDITLNAAGRTNTNISGISRFSLRLSWDILGSFTGSWSGSSESWIDWLGAFNSGITFDPKLVVTYTGDMSGVADMAQILVPSQNSMLLL